MGIVYCEADRTFTIQTKNTTYQMQVDRFGFLLHLYYGKKTDGSCMDYLLTYYDRGFSGNPYDAGSDRTYSMDALPQEYPCYGTGDYRSVALIIENADRSTACDLLIRMPMLHILPSTDQTNGNKVPSGSAVRTSGILLPVTGSLLFLLQKVFRDSVHIQMFQPLPLLLWYAEM